MQHTIYSPSSRSAEEDRVKALCSSPKAVLVLNNRRLQRSLILDFRTESSPFSQWRRHFCLGLDHLL